MMRLLLSTRRRRIPLCVLILLCIPLYSILSVLIYLQSSDILGTLPIYDPIILNISSIADETVKRGNDGAQHFHRYIYKYEGGLAHRTSILPRTVFAGSDGESFLAKRDRYLGEFNEAGTNTTANPLGKVPSNSTSVSVINPPKKEHPSSTTSVSPKKDMSAISAALNHIEVPSDDCIAMAAWQETSFPTCNTLHEIDGLGSDTIYMRRGGVRDVWTVENEKTMDSVTLKTVRWKNEFTPKDYGKQRRDAVALERLTSSTRVIDIYGYCGQSSLNQKANTNGAFAQLGWDIPITPLMKIHYASEAAHALADVHSIDGDDASVVHRDISPANFLLSSDQTSLLLNDFNTARFMTWNQTAKVRCGFRRQECNQNRSPEECMGGILTEKIDVYALGHVLYKILTGYDPYSFDPKHKKKKHGDMTSREALYRTVRVLMPTLPPQYLTSPTPEEKTIMKAMKSCYTYRAYQRPSAREIAQELDEAYLHFAEALPYE